jgi:hypothetical protein
MTGLCLASLSGCGGVIYSFKATSAASSLETAEALGAERYAPYEYWYAYEHLWKAMEEAATADYGDAIDFADTADDYAEKAIKLSKDAHQAGGR